ncbi:aminopeptidase P family protein [Nakamurella sp. A5-74]|uniref:Aminopeptidase P family protein n=1 Tax=Nakamurella sp. A5-74 TaxID=3158264 RepID=A0AAU8DMR9_9ACTN
MGSPGNHRRRRAAVAAALRSADLQALLVTDPVNIRYLTGFTGSAGALLIGSGSGSGSGSGDGSGDVGGTGGDDPASALCTDDRYALQAAEQTPDLALVIDRTYELALLPSVRGRCGFEADHVTVARSRLLTAAAQDAGFALVPTSDVVERGREIKDAGEIALLRRACAVADEALARLIQAGGLAVGRTEREAALDLDFRMMRLGAHAPSFATILAAGEHSAVPHHEPTDRPLAAGDLVKIDFGAEVAGYHSDMTRTFVLGRAADWQRDLHALVLTAQTAGRVAVAAGADGAAIDAAARDVIVAAGQGEYFGHGLGHGVGLRIHEAPALDARSTAIMRPGMCVTVEPGIYLTGRGGVRIEDTGVVRASGPDASGYEVLTLTGTELLEL